jgi:hypothetical protein
MDCVTKSGTMLDASGPVISASVVIPVWDIQRDGTTRDGRQCKITGENEKRGEPAVLAE